MQVKSQPWIHSWYGDSVAFFLIPLLFITLAIFDLPPFGNFDQANFSTILRYVLIIDWGHIFAQWYRIYSNPLETNTTKVIYPVSYLLLIPLTALFFQLGQIDSIETLLVYFVIYHFIKQHFGFIRIYSKIDGPKTKFESVTESALTYLCMWTPVLYWHSHFPKQDFYWILVFFKSPMIKALFWPAVIAYAFCLLAYVYAEHKRWKRNGVFNWPKNLALATSALGWGLVSGFVKTPLLIFFTVVLTHDLSYIFFVWMIGRRDERIQHKKVRFFSFWSAPGFIFYVFTLFLLAQSIWGMHIKMGHNQDRPLWLVGNFFSSLPFSEGWWQNVGLAFFYATQAHHYFIDRFLWKKEKDLAYMVKVGAA